MLGKNSFDLVVLLVRRFVDELPVKISIVQKKEMKNLVESKIRKKKIYKVEIQEKVMKGNTSSEEL